MKEFKERQNGKKYESSVRAQSSNVLILQFYAPSTKLQLTQC